MQSLITSTTARQPTAEELDTNRVDTAPLLLQLPMDMEENRLTAASRTSTIYEEKIAIALDSGRDKVSPTLSKVPETSLPSKPSTADKNKSPPNRAPSVKSNIIKRKISIPATPKTPLRSARNNITARTVTTPRTPKQSLSSARSNATARNVTTPRTPKQPLSSARSNATARNVTTPRTPKQPLSSARSNATARNVTTPRTSKHPVTPGQSASRQPRNRPNVSSQSKRNTVGASVQSLDKSKTNYVKYANAVFKDSTSIYRKKITNVGTIQKKKPGSAKGIKLKDVTMNSIESLIQRQSEPKLLENLKTSVTIDIDLFNEIKRPELKLDVHIPIPEVPIEEEGEDETPKTLEKEPEIQDIADDPNFFVCAAEEENPYAEYIEMQRKEREAELKQKMLDDKFLYDNNDRWSTVVPLVKKKVKESKVEPENKMNNVYKRVEKVAKFSILRNKFFRNSKNEEIKSQREAIIEEKVLTQIFYNYDFKTKTKVKQRKRRNKRTVDLVKNFKRIPTLVNWVECTDVLGTPAMKQQTKLYEPDTTIAPDNVTNQRYKFRLGTPILHIAEADTKL